MKKWMNKSVAISLVAATALGLCACGGNGAGKKTESEHYFKTEYDDKVPDNFGDGISGMVFQGDKIYYAGYTNDYESAAIYSYNLIDHSGATIWESEPFTSADGQFSGNTSPGRITIDESGSLYVAMDISQLDEESRNRDYSSATLDDVLNYFVENWGYSEEDAQNEWTEWWESGYTDENGNVDYGSALRGLSANYEYSRELWKFNQDGNLEWTYVAEEKENYSYSMYDVAVDKSGNIVILMNRWDTEGSEDVYYLEILNNKGEKINEIALNDYSDQLIELPDGGIAYTKWGDTGMEMIKIDTKTGEVSDSARIASSTTAIYDDNHLLMEDGTKLDLYNLKTGESEKYLGWMECSISSSSVVGFSRLSDGTLAVAVREYSRLSGTGSTQIALLTEVDKSELGDVQMFDIACMSLDSVVEERIIDFNRKHDDMKIRVTEYYDSVNETDSWEDQLNRFTTAVMADSDIDMIIFSDFSQAKALSEKGLLADLYPIMEANDGPKKDDFIPSILTASEVDGKLTSLSMNFTLSTLCARRDAFGDKLTLDDAINVTKTPDVDLLYNVTKSELMGYLMNLNYRKFIDTKNATCNFDNEEFVKILELCKTLPDDWNYEEDVNVEELYNQGKVLCSQYYMSDLTEVQLYEAVFGGDVSFVGYPSDEGNGALLSFMNTYGITNNCENKDVMWQFIAGMYDYLDADMMQYYYYGFSTLKAPFEESCKQAMKEKEDGYTSGWGEFEVEIQPATQAQVDQMKDLLYGTTAVQGEVTSDVLKLIEEEAQYFYSGEQSAENVAAKIQSRMEIYLSETK